MKKRPSADIHMFKAEYLTHDELHEIADDVREVAAKGNRFTPRGDDEPSPPLPIELNITDDDVDFALRKWDSLFPDFAGLLDAEVT